MIPQPLAFHFLSAFRRAYLATVPHSTGASTQPCHVHRDQRKSATDLDGRCKGHRQGEGETGDQAWCVWGLTFGGEYDNQYVLRGMMWADSYWLFCDNKERLVSIVNDIIEELLDLDLESKPESLWWTSTHHAEEKETLKVENRGLAWDLPFKDVFEVLGCRFHRDGKGV